MTLGRKGLTSWVINGLTVCCFTVCSLPSAPAHCFVWLCIAEPYKAVCLLCKAHTHSKTAHS
ncbi:unnamed protein product [Staurois parvus]|uniref:Secreted protein n=1 Tax=Staurois parvus TaxID=386267 RepID=A0ABN9ENK1_9NEOB|nr:unnamed protein product [Staurois parvus]